MRGVVYNVFYQMLKMKMHALDTMIVVLGQICMDLRGIPPRVLTGLRILPEECEPYSELHE